MFVGNDDIDDLSYARSQLRWLPTWEFLNCLPSIDEFIIYLDRTFYLASLVWVLPHYELDSC